ncbi:MAG: recombination regulator RecX [Nitrosomonas sp.]|nr:recombination regulator RecX [Nitrosomonas sp.]
MNNQPGLMARALKLLAQREHSRLELQTKLAEHAPTPDVLTSLLDSLEQRSLLSDERAVEQILHSRRKRYGSRRIVFELQEKGIADHLIAAALEDLKATEFSSAQAIWSKKFGVAPASHAERGKQERYLAGRGFSFDVIGQVLIKAGKTRHQD